MKTIIPTIPHILEDARNFLSRLNQLSDIPDMMGFYPHLPHEEGLETMKRYLDKREDQSVSSDSLYKLAKIILKAYLFQFGTRCIPSNLGHCYWHEICTTLCKHFMAGLEEEIFRNTEFQPLLWLRYWDGIFCLWSDTIEKLKEFHERISQCFSPCNKIYYESFTKSN